MSAAKDKTKLAFNQGKTYASTPSPNSNLEPSSTTITDDKNNNIHNNSLHFKRVSLTNHKCLLCDRPGGHILSPLKTPCLCQECSIFKVHATCLRDYKIRYKRKCISTCPCTRGVIVKKNSNNNNEGSIFDFNYPNLNVQARKDYGLNNNNGPKKQVYSKREFELISTVDIDDGTVIKFTRARSLNTLSADNSPRLNNHNFSNPFLSLSRTASIKTLAEKISENTISTPPMSPDITKQKSKLDPKITHSPLLGKESFSSNPKSSGSKRNNSSNNAVFSLQRTRSMSDTDRLRGSFSLDDDNSTATTTNKKDTSSPPKSNITSNLGKKGLGLGLGLGLHGNNNNNNFNTSPKVSKIVRTPTPLLPVSPKLSVRRLRSFSDFDMSSSGGGSSLYKSVSQQYIYQGKAGSRNDNNDSSSIIGSDGYLSYNEDASTTTTTKYNSSPALLHEKRKTMLPLSLDSSGEGSNDETNNSHNLSPYTLTKIKINNTIHTLNQKDKHSKNNNKSSPPPPAETSNHNTNYINKLLSQYNAAPSPSHSPPSISAKTLQKDFDIKPDSIIVNEKKTELETTAKSQCVGDGNLGIKVGAHKDISNDNRLKIYTRDELLNMSLDQIKQHSTKLDRVLSKKSEGLVKYLAINDKLKSKIQQKKRQCRHLTELIHSKNAYF